MEQTSSLDAAATGIAPEFSVFLTRSVFAPSPDSFSMLCPTDGKYFALISIQSCWISSPIFGVAHTKHVIASLNMYYCLRFIFRNAHLHAINLPKMTKLLPLQVVAYNFIQFALLVSMMTKLLPFLS